MTQLFANLASAKLAAAIASGDTSLTVVAGQGTLFPSMSGGDHVTLALIKADGSAIEVVDATARSSDTFTVVRAQEGTTALSFDANDLVKNYLSAGNMGDLWAAIALRATLASPTFTGTVTVPTTVNATDAAQKAYVDASVAGLSWKQEARVATAAAGTLATSFANGQTVDGVSLVTGDRILIKDQVSGAENGIYVVAVAGAPTRSTDATTGSQLVDASLYISEGTANADTAWTCTTDAPITVGVTALAFARFGVGATTDATISTSDITTNNVTSTKHGWAPKSPADATQFLNGAATPAYAQPKDSDLATTDVTTNNVSSTKHGFTPKSPADAAQFLNGAATPAFAAVTGANLSMSDVTTNNVSSTQHGFAPKSPGDATKFLNGAATPAFASIVELNVGASTQDAGNTSTAITVDWSLARTTKVTATGNFTLTHSNMVAGIVYTLEVYTGAGSFTGTFASTNFAGGTAPTITVTASKVDILTFYKTIGGTIMGGVFGQSFAP